MITRFEKYFAEMRSLGVLIDCGMIVNHETIFIKNVHFL